MASANEVGDSCLGRNSYGAALSSRVHLGGCDAADVGCIYAPTTLDDIHQHWSFSLQRWFINYVANLDMSCDNFQNLPPLNVVLQTT